jgi:hypothetical protein
LQLLRKYGNITLSERTERFERRTKMMIMPMEIECRCPFCGVVRTVTVDAIDYLAWEVGDALAQDAFPYLSADEREMLISGICPTCWEKTFG